MKFKVIEGQNGFCGHLKRRLKIRDTRMVDINVEENDVTGETGEFATKPENKLVDTPKGDDVVKLEKKPRKKLKLKI